MPALEHTFRCNIETFEIDRRWFSFLIKQYTHVFCSLLGTKHLNYVSKNLEFYICICLLLTFHLEYCSSAIVGLFCSLDSFSESSSVFFKLASSAMRFSAPNFIFGSREQDQCPFFSSYHVTCIFLISFFLLMVA